MITTNREINIDIFRNAASTRKRPIIAGSLKHFVELIQINGGTIRSDPVDFNFVSHPLIIDENKTDIPNVFRRVLGFFPEETKKLGKNGIALNRFSQYELFEQEYYKGIHKGVQTQLDHFIMGNMAYGKNDEHVFMGRDFGHTRDFSEDIAAQIDKEVKKIVDENYERAKHLLSKNRDMLDIISKELLEKETIDEKEFEELMNKVKSERNW